MIVIVGHGKSPEGKGWADRIDAGRWVIRMWNWSWQTPEDYGVKYDWGLIETHKRVMAEWREHNQHNPTDGWICSYLDKYKGCLRELPPKTRVVEQESWLKQPYAVAIGGRGVNGKWELSRGAIAACWAIENAQPGEQVVLVGFDNARAKVFLPLDQAASEAYQNAPAGFWLYPTYVSGGTKDGNHDVIAERLLMEIMATRQGVKLCFAQDIWP